jgi:hypothetical protein
MLLQLPDACRRVNELGVPVQYQRFLKAVAAGRVPAQRNETCTRWLIKADDLPAIAAAFRNGA